MSYNLDPAMRYRAPPRAIIPPANRVNAQAPAQAQPVQVAQNVIQQPIQPVPQIPVGPAALVAIQALLPAVQPPAIPVIVPVAPALPPVQVPAPVPAPVAQVQQIQAERRIGYLKRIRNKVKRYIVKHNNSSVDMIITNDTGVDQPHDLAEGGILRPGENIVRVNDYPTNDVYVRPTKYKQQIIEDYKNAFSVLEDECMAEFNKDPRPGRDINEYWRQCDVPLKLNKLVKERPWVKRKHSTSSTDSSVNGIEEQSLVNDIAIHVGNDPHPYVNHQIDDGVIDLLGPQANIGPVQRTMCSATQTNMVPENTQTEKIVDFDLLLSKPKHRDMTKFVRKQRFIKSYSKLTYFLKSKYFMKPRTMNSISSMVIDARTWLLQNNFKCEDETDYMILSQSVLATFLIDSQELLFRSTLKQQPNLSNWEHHNETLSGNLGKDYTLGSLFSNASKGVRNTLGGFGSVTAPSFKPSVWLAPRLEQSICTGVTPVDLYEKIKIDGEEINLIDVRTCNLGMHSQTKYVHVYDTNFHTPHTYYNNCWHNEFDALKRRHLLTLNYRELDHRVIRDLGDLMTDTAKQLRNREYLTENGADIVFENTRKSILPRYKAAYSNIIGGRLAYSERPGKLKAFVKYEKWPVSKIESGKPPRLIQYRPFEYIFSLKSFLLSHTINLKKSEIRVPEMRNQKLLDVFMKYKDNPSRARTLKHYWDTYTHPIAVCLDREQFDGNYNYYMVSNEIKFWNELFGNNRLLKILLKHQLRQSGKTKGSIKYKMIGKRGSGDYNTSDGNSMSNYNSLRQWLRASKVMGNIFVDGDDSVVIIEYSDYKKLLPLSFFNKIAMPTKKEAVTDIFEEITFCQSHPVEVNGNWFMIKDWLRTISRYTVCPSKFKECLSRYLVGVGLCELACSTGVPILQSFAIRLISDGNNARPLGSVDKTPAKAMSNDIISISNIATSTRESFERAYCIGIAEQIQYERAIAGDQIDYPSVLKLISKYESFHLN